MNIFMLCILPVFFWLFASFGRAFLTEFAGFIFGLCIGAVCVFVLFLCGISARSNSALFLVHCFKFFFAYMLVPTLVSFGLFFLQARVSSYCDVRGFIAALFGAYSIVFGLFFYRNTLFANFYPAAFLLHGYISALFVFRFSVNRYARLSGGTIGIIALCMCAIPFGICLLLSAIAYGLWYFNAPRLLPLSVLAVSAFCSGIAFLYDAIRQPVVCSSLSDSNCLE